MSGAHHLVKIDGEAIAAWDGFHDVFAKAFGFPPFYGRNADAWVDCMTSLDLPDDGLSTKHVNAGEILTLEVTNASGLKAQNPAIWNALNEMTAFVNWRRLEQGDGPILALSYHV